MQLNRTRIKICGITRLEDALQAVALGVDALGFVFVPSSPRYVSMQKAQQILAQLPPFVQTVGLFMDTGAANIEQVLGNIPLDLLQFHGSEDEAFCVQWHKPYIKVVAMGDAAASALLQAEQDYASAAGLLLDSHRQGQSGGSGKVFDWAMIPTGMDKPIVLAGGLNCDNVSQAVAQVKPYAVDVSSGVEADKGIKDAKLMRQFVEGVKQGDQLKRA